jgi:DNA-directed RNA polymerase specialized sigma24 family protein
LPDRDIVVLRHYGQLSFKELAAHFKMPLGTVLAKVHRSLKRLKVLLEKEPNHE